MSVTPNEQSNSNQSIVIGVFDTIFTAQRAVDSLRVAGFAKEQISVISSETQVVQHFPDYQPDAGPETWKVATALGAAAGGLITGAVGAAALATGASIPVVVAGGLASMLTGGVVGGLAGAMAERGYEPSAVDYYVTAVADGRCLVAVETSSEHQTDADRDQAVKILREAGSEPIRIPGGQQLG